MDYFLTYAGSVSFRELKNAKKKYFFLNLGGVGTKTRFLSKKKSGKNIGSGGEKYWVSLPYIHGCACNIIIIS